jgi:hypothetical protein
LKGKKSVPKRNPQELREKIGNAGFQFHKLSTDAPVRKWRGISTPQVPIPKVFTDEVLQEFM